MDKKRQFIIFLAVILFTSISSSFAQTKKNPKPKVTPKKNVQTEKVEIPTKIEPEKTNRRPQTDNQNISEKPDSRPVTQKKEELKPNYFYEFSQPQFTITKINLSHDEQGKGQITFEKRDFGEPITDPIQISEFSMNKLKGWFDALNFLDSTEDYQTERHYAHMGVMKIKLKRDGKEREVTLDWTQNLNAKALVDEYRKLADQYVWIFDMNVAKENQPLEAPKLIEAFGSMYQRGDISDPNQMLPMLKDLSNDERIPLIGRNRLKKIIEKIEKPKK
jgi:hypothetical protein